jgi:hypothetical protein
MQAYIGEFIGTMILIILGDGVVAGVLLRNSKAENSGWIVITFGWAMAVAVAVYCVRQIGQPHDDGTDEGTQKLGDDVGNYIRQRELSRYGKTDGHGGINMSA